MLAKEMDVKVGVVRMQEMGGLDVLRLGRQFLTKKKEMAIGYALIVAIITMPRAKFVTDVLVWLPLEKGLPDQMQDPIGA